MGSKEHQRKSKSYFIEITGAPVYRGGFPIDGIWPPSSVFTGLRSSFGRWVIWFYYVYLFIYLFFTSANFSSDTYVFSWINTCADFRRIGVFFSHFSEWFEFVLCLCSEVWLGCLDFCYLNRFKIEFLSNVVLLLWKAYIWFFRVKLGLKIFISRSNNWICLIIFACLLS